MKGSFDTMRMDDGAEIAVYHVQPTAQRRGGLVLIQEIFGVTEHIRELCDDYADEGYEVLAPSLYDREQPRFEAAYSGPDFDRAVEIARNLHPFAVSVADALACVDTLAGPVFITGYCYGGSVAYAAACESDKLAAASGYYGSQVPGMKDRAPRCPTIMHFGRYDTGIPVADVEVFAVARADVGVFMYDANHGFNSDRRKDYHEPSANLARERTLGLFRTCGG